MLQYILHKANSRGLTNWGWLHTRHTFSFAEYYDPKRMHFGALRVLNDDMVAPSKGFGMHPHSNMEIITIPLEGVLEHQDDMGHHSLIRKGEVQVMSAGSGLFHSELNPSKNDVVKLLQIWVFPNKQEVNPRYDQVKYCLRENELVEIVTPEVTENAVWIHQDAWFYLGKMTSVGVKIDYRLNRPSRNGLYVFVISGSLRILDLELNQRDGVGVWDLEHVLFESLTDDVEFLVMEIPMQV